MGYNYLNQIFCSEVKMDQYSYRINAFSQENRYKLYEDFIEVSSNQEEKWIVNYANITSITLQNSSSNRDPDQYSATISYKGGKIQITNSAYNSNGESQKQNVQYYKFIQALHHKVASINSNVIYNQRGTKLNYLLSVFTVIFIVLALTFGIYYSFTHQFMGLVAVKVIVLLFATPYMIDYLKKNRPDKYDPLNIPDTLLPQ